MKFSKSNRYNPYAISLFYVLSALLIYFLTKDTFHIQLSFITFLPLFFILVFTAVIFFLIDQSNKHSRDRDRTLNLIATALNNVNEGITITDKEGNIQWVNPAFCSLTKYQEVELLGMNIKSFLQYDLDPAYYESISKQLLNGEPYKDYIINEKKNGEIFYEQFTITPFKSDGDDVSHFIAIFRDITENTMNMLSLEESLEEKETLLEEIHHRVKNNLATISGLIELQLFKTQSEEARRILTNTQGRLKSIALVHEKLYNDYLFSEIDLEDYLEDLVESIRDLLKSEKDITFSFDTESVTIDMVQAVPFGLLATEIITNSYKHAFKNREQGKIHIALKRLDNGTYSFTVKDNGIGLPDDYELGQSDSLGLKLIQTLTQQIGATISIDHSDGVSYTLLFELKTNNKRKREEKTSTTKPIT
ncbi:MAG TPA: histidine kinase dimerization/phosphoacceptor domain -containing protein [Balneolales bacterium]|nr:histidine kinase dimerization/phosphoacceptor domain -containing protein [Balneolales bacterium]